MTGRRHRRLDRVEAIVNASLGLIVSYIAVIVLFPLFGWDVTSQKSFAISVIFFALSVLRGYVLRRVFRWIDARGR